MSAESIFENTKTAAYFLWEITKNSDAMSMWFCAEDIAHYFEKRGLLELDCIKQILRKRKNDIEYVEFIRNIAFRIYVYTGRRNKAINWFDAERLAFNLEWRVAEVNIAKSFREASYIELCNIKSEKIKNYYQTK